MKCDVDFELLSERIDGRLPEWTAVWLEDHLRACAFCQDRWKALSEAVGWARAIPEHPAPDWLEARILAGTPRIERETWRDTFEALHRWLAVRPRVAATAAAALTLAVWTGLVFGAGPVVQVLDPRMAYERFEKLTGDAYDTAVRTYYRTPLVTAIHSQIDQWRERS